MSPANLLVIFFATYLIWIFAPVFLWLVHTGDKVTVFRVLGSSLLALVLSLIIKDYYYLPRPFILSGHLPLVAYGLDGSLPSGHTAVSFAFSLAVFSRRRRLGLGLIMTSLLIAFGRIAGGVHTPLDVFVGLLIAVVSFLFARRFFRD